MKLSRKQQIYQEILELVLPLFRNVEALPMPVNERQSYVLEADLVHNLPARLLEPEFQEEDLHWLNVDARSYVVAGAGQSRLLYPLLCTLIAELFDLVPEEMKPGLECHGP